VIPLLVGVIAHAQGSACPVEWEYDKDECWCNCRTPNYVFPPSGTVVPTNVVIRLNLGGSDDAFRALVNGEVVSSVETTWMPYDYYRRDGLDLGHYQPSVPLEPGDQIEIWTSGLAPGEVSERAGIWTVGDGPDTTPPTWDGSYDVKTIDVADDGCGLGEHSHYVTFDGAADDWPGAGALVVADADGGDYLLSELGDEGGFAVRWDGCSLAVDLCYQFHRTYQVRLEDAAGNVLGPFEITTGEPPAARGCGKAEQAGPSEEECAPYTGVTWEADPGKSSCGNDQVVPASLALAPLVLLRRLSARRR
jgi:hypothetical protein